LAISQLESKDTSHYFFFWRHTSCKLLYCKLLEYCY